MQNVTDNVFCSFRFLFTSWQESLSIFGAGQVKLFFLATIKAVKDVYRLFIQTTIFSLYFFLALGIQLISLDNKFVQLIAGLCLTVLIINALRPSVSLKDSSYFTGVFARGTAFAFDILFFFIFMPYAFIAGIQRNYILILCAFLLLLPMTLVQIIKNKNSELSARLDRRAYGLYASLILLYTVFLWYLIFSAPTGNFLLGDNSITNFMIKARSLVLSLLFINETWIFTLLSTLAYFLSPFIIVAILFIADTQPYNLKEYFKAIGRAALMVLYNYPFFMLLFLAVCLVIYFFSVLGNVVPLYLPTHAVGTLLVSIVLLPVYIGIISSFYIKRLHEQFQLYYRDN